MIEREVNPNLPNLDLSPPPLFFNWLKEVKICFSGVPLNVRVIEYFLLSPASEREFVYVIAKV